MLKIADLKVLYMIIIKKLHKKGQATIIVEKASCSQNVWN